MSKWMKNALRSFLSNMGLMLSSDHEQFRQSCVDFCDEHIETFGDVAGSGKSFKSEAIDGNIFVLGDRVSFCSCSVRGKIICAPWTRSTGIYGCIIYGERL